jgi:choline dehydrogenase
MGVSATSSKNFTSIGPACTFGAPGDPCLPLVRVPHRFELLVNIF